MAQTAESQLNPRTAFRQAVRERAFAAALERLQDEGWNQLRISQIAKDIGVSRPTIYAEFGTKQEFGQALLERETIRVLGEFSGTLEANKNNPEKALEKAFAKAIELGRTSPLVPAILNPNYGPVDPDSSPYGFVTEGLLPLIAASSYTLAAWIKEIYPNTSDTEIKECTDVLARLTLSHIMTPDNTPKKTPKQLAKVAILLLPELGE